MQESDIERTTSNQMLRRREIAEYKTPSIVVELLQRLVEGSVYVPFTTKNQFIEELALSATIHVAREGIRMPEQSANKLLESNHVTAVDSLNSVPESHIVLDPPFGLRYPGFKYGLRDEALIHFTDALPVLGDNKYAIISCPLGVTFRIPELRWLAMLRDQGIYLQSVAQLPAGAYPSTSIEVVILIFSRNPSSKYLSIELREENADSSIGRIKAWLAEPDALQSDTDLIIFEPGIPLRTSKNIRRSNMISKAIVKQGFPILNILENATINTVRNKDTYTDEVNAIYVPNIGLSNVVTSTSDMTMKNQFNYFQIILSGKFDAEYVARLLNTNIGKTVREDLMSGTYIAKINLVTLREGELNLPIPPPTEQAKISALHNDIETSINQLRSVQDELDNHPKKLRDLRTSYSQMIQADNNAWIELLPSHLAIMLKKYYVAPEAEQYKRLIEFFEALNHLFAAIYFSFLKNSPDDKLWQSFKGGSTELDLSRVFDQSTFGSWYRFMSTAGNYIRASRAINDNDTYPNKISIEQAMDITSPQLIPDLLNAMISKVCKIAQEERNRDAHGFDTTPNIQLLQKLLNDIQPKLVAIFSHYKLVGFKQAQPGEGKLRPFTVNILHGSSAVFQSAEIELDHGMNNIDIYLYEEDSVRALKMQPILRLMSSPSNIRNTVYYFDKKLAEESIYKAYLDADGAEVRLADSGLSY